MNRPIATVICFSLMLTARLATPAWGADAATSQMQGTGAASQAAQNTIDKPTNADSLKITLADAIVMALENNRSLQVQRLNPLIRQTWEEEARGEFDPTLKADISQAHESELRLPQVGTVLYEVENDTFLAGLALETYFPSGTTLVVEADTQIIDVSTNESALAATRLGVALTQALLRGFGREVNLVDLRQANLETESSRYELLGFSQTLVSQVESVYWDYALSLRQVEILEESLRLARQQLSETREMIQVGTVAESELAAVQAEVATQQQGYIDVTSALESNRLRLLRLLNPPGPQLWDRTVTLVHPPTLPEIALGEVGSHVDLGLRLRPEIRQAELEIQRDTLELVRTTNGLLPKLDLFITLGKSGYADSFGGSISDLKNGGRDGRLGLILDYPLRNRAAKARHQRAQYSKEQSEEALDNLKQLVTLDIRIAFLEVNRTHRQIDASKATRIFQEEKLRTETEKFRVGRSTNLLVAQSQRDLLVSRLDEVRAVVNYLKALTNFYRLEGTLLDRRGVHVPE